VAKMNELSELVNFESKVNDTGAVEIQVNGMTVLDENQAYGFRPEIDDVNKVIRLRLDNGHIIQVDGGQLGAEIEMYSEDVPELKERLDRVASTLVTRFNDVHHSGFGLQDNIHRDFFDPGFTTASGIEV